MSTFDGGRAFPLENARGGFGNGYKEGGMTLRDYFAAQAMQIKFGPRGTTMDLPKLAASCYQMADAMLKAREATP